MKVVRVLRGIHFVFVGTLKTGEVVLVTDENRIVQGKFINMYLASCDYEVVDVVGLNQELLQRREEVKLLMIERDGLMELLPKKVVLPKEVAEAIEHIIMNQKVGFVYDLDGISKVFEKIGEPYGAVVRFATASRNNMATYFKALVNGYEVEQTPEDRVLNYFNAITPKGWKFTGDANDPVYIARDAIRTICIMLGKEVEGLNVKQE